MSNTPQEETNLVAGRNTTLQNDPDTNKNNDDEVDDWKKACSCEEGWLVCLVYGCVDLNCCCCCPCDCYIHMGWSLFMYVAFTFIYELYDVGTGSATKMEYIVYSFEMFFVDIPIMILAWIDKPQYLIYTIFTQIISSIGHIIITYIYFHHNDVSDGIYMLTCDVPFEIILCVCLIPFWQGKIPLWERRDIHNQVKYEPIENGNADGIRNGQNTSGDIGGNGNLNGTTVTNNNETELTSGAVV